MIIRIPIKLPSLANSRMHWRDMDRLKRQQRLATKYALTGRAIPPLPLIVTIRRIGPRKLDGDNLQAACKYVRDQIAAHVGEDDGSPRYTWIYEQVLDKQCGVEIEIVERTGTGVSDQ